VGLWEGSTENKSVASHLLSDLVARGLDAADGLLVVIDGAKALSAAVTAVFGLIRRRSNAVPSTNDAMSSSICQSPKGTGRLQTRARTQQPGRGRRARRDFSPCLMTIAWGALRHPARTARRQGEPAGAALSTRVERQRCAA
jgi:hypothetical protein